MAILPFTMVIFSSILFVLAFIALAINHFSLKKFEKKFFIEGEEERRVLKKFYDELIKICRQELIYVRYYNNTKELNEAVYENESERNAAGVYQHLTKEYNTPLNRISKEFPKIHVVLPTFSNREGYSETYVLAHELGHHFCFEYYNDTSEESANKYIFALARKVLTDVEIAIIHIGLSVRIGSDVDEKYVKRSEAYLNKLALKKLWDECKLSLFSKPMALYNKLITKNKNHEYTSRNSTNR